MSAAPTPASAPASAEIVRQLGPDRRTVAIITPPSGAASAGGAPLGCVLVNAGVIHRIGPHRLNVKLARHLARLGVASVRLDLSGRGDTPAARDDRPMSVQVLDDLRAAMDELTRLQGCRQFVMFGICSGAVNAMDLALVDERLVGLCLYDGHAFPTWKSQCIRYWRNITRRSPAAVADSIARRLVPARGTDDGAAPRPDPNGRGLAPMAAPVFLRQLQQVTGRGAQVRVMYSGSIGGHYNYAAQFDDVFGSAGLQGVSCDYLPQLDHTLTALAAQSALIERVAAWAVEIRAGQAAAPALRGAA